MSFHRLLGVFRAAGVEAAALSQMRTAQQLVGSDCSIHGPFHRVCQGAGKGSHRFRISVHSSARLSRRRALCAVRTPLRALSFEADGANFHHTLATLKVAVPGSELPVTFISAHLCTNGPEVRRREAAYLGVHAAPDRLTLITGDFNSASPHDGSSTASSRRRIAQSTTY